MKRAELAGRVLLIVAAVYIAGHVLAAYVLHISPAQFFGYLAAAAAFAFGLAVAMVWLVELFARLGGYDR